MIIVVIVIIVIIIIVVIVIIGFFVLYTVCHVLNQIFAEAILVHYYCQNSLIFITCCINYQESFLIISKIKRTIIIIV